MKDQDKPTKTARQLPIVRISVLFVVFMATWLLWSGLYKPLVIGLGVFSCVLAIVLTLRMPKVDGEVIEHGPILRSIGYLPWLLKEIAKANWDVTKIVLGQSSAIDPVLFRTKASQKTNTAQVIYGNSITLTPGTITVDIHDSDVIVHALTEAGAQAVKSGEMDQRVTQLEKGRA